jgi:hypothetical protein
MNYPFLHKALFKSKFILLFFCIHFIACNNQTENTTSNKDTTSKNTTTTTTGSWTQEDELEFIAGCVDNAKARFGEAKAFTYCRCIFNQVKTKYTSMDSTTMIKLRDTAEVAKMAKNCE